LIPGCLQKQQGRSGEPQSHCDPKLSEYFQHPNVDRHNHLETMVPESEFYADNRKLIEEKARRVAEGVGDLIGEASRQVIKNDVLPFAIVQLRILES